MVKRRINIIILGMIILCSTSMYTLKFLGPLQEGAELMGVGIIFILIIFHLVYSNQKSIKQNYSLAIFLIILSMLTSMLMAYFERDQRIIHTLYGQRAIYYYFLYFLLHQLKFDPKDLIKIIIFFGVLYIGLHFLQTVLYPKVIYDAYVRSDRGTIRIYLSGSHYIGAMFYLTFQRFLRSNKLKYILLLLLIVSVNVMRGGRQGLAILIFVVVLFIIIDRKVRSKFFLIFLGLIGAFSIFLIFQNIFMEMFSVSNRDLSLGEDYIRLKAARFYLTDFFESPLAYITGNGMYFLHSEYGKLINLNYIKYHYHLGDIGLIGNYAIYGLFFVIGVLIICIKSLVMKIESEYIFIKYLFIAIILSLMTSRGFSESDFVCYIVCILYLIDVSNNAYLQNYKTIGNRLQIAKAVS